MIEYQQLSIALDKLLQLYRYLLSVVQKEESILISSHLENLKESNKAKEKMIQKISDMETELNTIYATLAKHLKINESKPSLLVLAQHTTEIEWKIKLENYHKVFEILLKDLTNMNRKNAQMIEAAQSYVQGAMDAIKDAIILPSTYEGSGKVEEKNKKAAGSFINKEA